MKKYITTGVLLLISFLGYSQTKNFIDQPYIETQVKVDTLVTADRIYLKILLQEKDSKGKVSLEVLEEKMANKLKELGVDIAKDLSLVDLSSNFKKYFLKRKDVLKNKAYSLLVYDGKTAGNVILALEKLNISNVNLEKLEHSGIEQVKLLIQSKAILKAKRQADYLSNPLGQKTGKAIYISKKINQFRSFDKSNLEEVVIMGYGSKRKKFEAIEIEFKKIKVETEIHVKFKLE